MSDSLRDQLLKAGFNEPKTKPKPARKPSGNTNRRPPKKQASAGAGSGQSGNNRPDNSRSGGHQSVTRQSGAEQSATVQTGSATTAKSNAPLAGYTHVKAVPAKKKKKQKAPAIKPRASSWGTKDHTASTNNENTLTGTAGGSANGSARDPAKAQEHKQRKEAIQKLIESTALKAFKGDEIYRFTMKNKIRELLVSETVRKQLADSEMAITRLNGGIFVIPANTARDIRGINPQWVIFMASDAPDSTADDEEFPVPDDLVW